MARLLTDPGRLSGLIDDGGIRLKGDSAELTRLIARQPSPTVKPQPDQDEQRRPRAAVSGPRGHVG